MVDLDEYVERTSLYVQRIGLRASTLSVQAEYAPHTQSGGTLKLSPRFGPRFGLRMLGFSWAILILGVLGQKYYWALG